ncbi:MAG: phosphatidate cytidylyltransferase [Gammaproteobacteria bacterium]
MLKQRLITAAVLIPLVVFGVLYGTHIIVGAIFAAILLGGAWEWARLAGVEARGMRIAYVALTALILLGTYLVLPVASLPRVLVGLGVVVWAAALMWLFRPGWGKAATLCDVATKLVMGLVILPVAWASLVLLHATGESGPALLLYLVVSIWIADSGAYFAGKRFGRNKLAPSISPGKTREGALGGLAAVAVYALVLAQFMDSLPMGLLPFVLLSVFTAAISIAGDLFESLLKRQVGIKDSGALLPGHGGVLDRIDSLLAALPVFLAGLWLVAGA